MTQAKFILLKVIGASLYVSDRKNYQRHGGNLISKWTTIRRYYKHHGNGKIEYCSDFKPMIKYTPFLVHKDEPCIPCIFHCKLCRNICLWDIQRWFAYKVLIKGIAINVSPWWSSPPWWRHQMETFSTLLAICAGNSPVPGEFPTQRPVTRSFDVFLDLRLNKRLSKQSWG